MTMLQLNNLELQRGAFHLGPIQLEIRQGEIFALLGRTGSGKTLLLETIAGFYDRNYTGSIELFGQNLRYLPATARRLAFVYQDCGLFPHMTVTQNIAYGLRMQRLRPAAIDRTVQEMMALLSITHIGNSYPAMISGGERQRTALARALVLRPKLLLLDEPFSALDPSTREQMYEEIQRIHTTLQCTILFVTHNFAEAQRLAQRAGILLKGQLQAVADTASLFQLQHDPAVASFLGGFTHGSEGIV